MRTLRIKRARGCSRDIDNNMCIVHQQLVILFIRYYNVNIILSQIFIFTNLELRFYPRNYSTERYYYWKPNTAWTSVKKRKEKTKQCWCLKFAFLRTYSSLYYISVYQSLILEFRNFSGTFPEIREKVSDSLLRESNCCVEGHMDVRSSSGIFLL